MLTSLLIAMVLDKPRMQRAFYPVRTIPPEYLQAEKQRLMIYK